MDVVVVSELFVSKFDLSVKGVLACVEFQRVRGDEWSDNFFFKSRYSIYLFIYIYIYSWPFIEQGVLMCLTTASLTYVFRVKL